MEEDGEQKDANFANPQKPKMKKDLQATSFVFGALPSENYSGRGKELNIGEELQAQFTEFLTDVLRDCIDFGG